MDGVRLCGVGRKMGGAMVTVTVLMSVFDAPVHELAQAVTSIRNQSYSRLEFLIVDDGSTDPETLAYLDWCAAADERIRLVREGHRGLTVSLNCGLELARGSLIARQDADDWSDPERLARQVQFFANNPTAILCGTNAWTHQQTGFRLWRTRLPQSPSQIAAALPKGNPFVHGSTMFSRRAALSAGGYRAEFRCSQDYDFFWRLSELGGAFNLPDSLYHYRYSANSISAAKAAEQNVAHRAAKSLAALRRNGDPEDPAHAISVARCELDREPVQARALLKQADHMMLAGAYRKACAAYLQLLKRYPTNLLAWGKLARLGLFVTVPSAREACFR